MRREQAHALAGDDPPVIAEVAQLLAAGTMMELARRVEIWREVDAAAAVGQIKLEPPRDTIDNAVLRGANRRHVLTAQGGQRVGAAKIKIEEVDWLREQFAAEPIEMVAGKDMLHIDPHGAA